MAITLKLSEVCQDENLKNKLTEKCCVKPKATQYNLDPESVGVVPPPVQRQS